MHPEKASSRVSLCCVTTSAKSLAIHRLSHQAFDQPSAGSRRRTSASSCDPSLWLRMGSKCGDRTSSDWDWSSAHEKRCGAAVRCGTYELERAAELDPRQGLERATSTACRTAQVGVKNAENRKKARITAEKCQNRCGWRASSGDEERWSSRDQGRGGGWGK